jgi:hypothetical protein
MSNEQCLQCSWKKCVYVCYSFPCASTIQRWNHVQLDYSSFIHHEPTCLEEDFTNFVNFYSSLMKTCDDCGSKSRERGQFEVNQFTVWTMMNGEFITGSMSGFGGLVVSMLASGTQDRGFAPDHHAFLRRGSKTICLMSQLWGM